MGLHWAIIRRFPNVTIRFFYKSTNLTVPLFYERGDNTVAFFYIRNLSHK